MKKTTLCISLILAIAVSALAAQLSIKVIQDPAALPSPLAEFVQKGDFLVSDGQYTAVIAVSVRPYYSSINYGHPDASGYLLAFLPEGASKRAQTQIGVPSLEIGDQDLKVGPASVRQDGSRIIVRAPCENGDGIRLEVQTTYSFAFETGKINIVSEIRNAGPSEVAGLSFGLGANAFQSYSFSPFNAKSFPNLNIRVWQRPDHALGWFNPNPRGTRENPLPGRLRPGQVYRMSYSLVAGSGPVEVLNRLYALTGTKTEPTPFDFGKFEDETEIVIKEPVSGSVFFRAFMEKPDPLTVPLPKGTYDVQAHFFPAIVEKNFTVNGRPDAKPLILEAPEFGRVKVSIVDKKSNPALGKVSFIGLSPTLSPYFNAENPVLTGRGWERFKNSVYPLREELDVLLPAGTYLATSSRGPEYTRETKVIEVLAGENPALEFRLEKVVDTRGLVAVDSHMHTQNSDGRMLIPERLRSVVGEGLDVAVATDHNFITDYRPDLERLGLENDLAVITGEEVTARTGSIHYNTFPNALRSDEPTKGAISVKDETPATLFELSRTKNPETLIHVNHPRSRGLGYFLTYELESGTAASAKAPFNTDFDVMEIMNGAERSEANRNSTEDFFHFLNRGYSIRAVGSSDSHGIDGSEPGYCRTYVLYDGPKGAELDQAALVQAMKEGRSFVSNGPVVSVRANRGARLGDLVKAKKGRVDLDIRVSAAPWLDVSEVRLVVNGERREPLPIEGADGKTIKFKDRVRVELEKDAWIAVEVRGQSSLYPVVQQPSGDGTSEKAVLPYALTNPIFFDVEGDGRCDTVWPEKVVIE